MINGRDVAYPLLLSTGCLGECAPMRVAMVVASISRSGGGIAAVVESLARYVADSGVEVGVFSLADEAWRAGDNQTWSGPTPKIYTRIGPRSLGYAPMMARGLIDWNPDLVHLHGLWMHPSRSVLQWTNATGRPYIISPHGMLSPTALSFSPTKKRISLALFQRESLAKAAYLHATAEEEAAEFRIFGLNNDMVVVPNGIDVPELNDIKSPPFGKKTILYLGRIHPKKGLDTLINAWQRIESEHKDWQLKIIGPSEGGHLEHLQQLVAISGVKRVLFGEAIYGQEKQKAYQDAEIFVLPTRNENFALVVPEALVNMTPVISTKGAPWKGLIENGCGWWIDHGVEPLAEALAVGMATPKEVLASMGARGREWMIRDYSWTRIAADMVAAYTNILRGTQRASSSRNIG